MARPARFTHDGILDAAAHVAERRWRDATVADVAAELHTPAGSIYYRYPSRDALFGSLWLRAVERFHVGYLNALESSDASAGAREAAAHIVRFCREAPLDAVAMTLYRQSDLVAVVHGDLARRVDNVNVVMNRRLEQLTESLFGEWDAASQSLVRTACVESPYGLVRRHIRGDEPIPAWLENAARASTSAILALGAGQR